MDHQIIDLKQIKKLNNNPLYGHTETRETGFHKTATKIKMNNVKKVIRTKGARNFCSLILN